MTNAFDLTGKVALVTGAGQGIGLAIAQTLAEAGADIVIADFNRDTGESAAAVIRNMGRRAAFIEVDVRNSRSVAAMTEEAVKALGAIDVLVNNAGIVRNTPAEAVPDDEWLNIINVNLNGVFWCCREVGNYMLGRGHGVIVNIASMSGTIVNKPQPQTAYNVSKAGVIMLTKSLAMEWAQRGVRVNSVSPGYIGTEMTKLGMNKTEWSSVWLEMSPVGRIGEPVDVANAVLYLSCDASAFATGSNLVVDGGYSVW
ncbi:MAG TPA: glucose 1-dehydrogenase [Phototrophicaceae bacterium]|nr:glucose 1-dehydrogenase [Phototrophicaceae bacterium]